MEKNEPGTIVPSSRRPWIVALCAMAILAELPATARPISASSPAGSQPPVVTIDSAVAIGAVFHSAESPPESVTIALAETCSTTNFATAPRVVAPAGSRLVFRWHAEAGPGAHIVSYRYWLDADTVVVDSSVHGADYGQVAPPGHAFTVMAIDDHGGSAVTPCRRFRIGLPPDTWFAGPDTTVLDARFGWTGHDRHLDIADWNALPDLSGSLLSCDSLRLRPAQRPQRKTFFEIYGNRLYVRSEDDTVHVNSWVVLGSGGSDLDSPYDVPMGNDPALADTAHCDTNRTLRPAGVVGSPTGFRVKVPMKLDPGTFYTIISFSNIFPNFDPFSAFRSPWINGYQAVTQSGRAYAHLRAVGSDHLEDESVGNPVALVNWIESGTAPPEVKALRHKVLTFYVNRSPYLLRGAPGFVPQPNQVFASRTLHLNLLADDDDPFNYPAPPPGGPSAVKVLRRNVRLLGRDAHGDPVSLAPLAGPVFNPLIDVVVPEEIVGPEVTLDVELCDCQFCETQAGTGRCVHDSIPILVPTGQTATLASLLAADALPDRVTLRWRLGSSSRVIVERRAIDAEWRTMAMLEPDGRVEVSYVDADVVPGLRYGYRLRAAGGAGDAVGGEVWVDVPKRFALELAGLRPNPATGRDLTVVFSLPNAAPGRLEILDLSGRRWIARDTGALGAGRHALRVAGDTRLPPGIYLVRLVHGADTRVARAVVLE